MGPIKNNITVASGTGELVLVQQWDTITWVRVIPPNEKVTYDLELEDTDGHLIVYRTAIVGTFAEMLQISLAILSTVSILNASADGTFTVKFDLGRAK